MTGIRTETVGMIAPERLYSTDAVMSQCGIGSESLREARASGIVNALDVGGRIYYEGSEIIEWIKAKAKERQRTGKTRRSNRDSASNTSR